MIKKLFKVTIFTLILILFITFIPNLFKSPVHAAIKCTAGGSDKFPIPITVVLDNNSPSLQSGGVVIAVTGQGPKEEGKYAIFISPVVGNVEGGVVWSLPNFTLDLDEAYHIDAKFSDFSSEVKVGNKYIVRVIKSTGSPASLDQRCGETRFEMTSTGIPNITYGELKDNGENKNTILNHIEATGLQSGEYYVFRLLGKWGERDYLESEDSIQIHRASSNGRILIPNICENGEGARLDCTETFRTGTYTIGLKQYGGFVPLDKRLNDSNKKNLGNTIVVSEFYVDDGQITEVPATEIPGLVAIGAADVNVVASGFASTFLSFGIGIAGGIAFLLMVFGAYRLIFAGGNPDAMQQGREIITAAIAGLLVIIFAVFILRFLGFTILGLSF